MMEIERTIRGSTHRWVGTEQELQAWLSYKEAKAQRLMEEGYSVEWEADVQNLIHIFPGRDEQRAPFVASVKCFLNPCEWGIDGGRITRFEIETSDGNLYHHKEEELLANPDAKRLIDTVIRVLN